MSEKDAKKSGPAEKGKEKIVALNTRDLILLFIFFVVVLMIVFTIGLMVGKNFTEKLPSEARAGEDAGKQAARTDQVGVVQETDLPPIRGDSRTVGETMGKGPGEPAKLASEAKGPEPVLTEVATPPARDAAKGSVAKEIAKPDPKPVAATATVPAGKEPPAKTAPAEVKPPKEVPAVAKKPVPPANTAEGKVSDNNQKRAESAEVKGACFVQVRACTTESEAEQIAKDLRQKGYPTAYIRYERADNGYHFKVRLGNFSSRVKAEEVLKRLPKEYKGAFIK